MSANKYAPHIHVLPEDDANRQIANGFWLDEFLASRRLHVLEEAGGWHQAVERFLNVYARQMELTPTRVMVLLLDCDKHPERPEQVRDRIPTHLRDRVFILGVLSEPEALKSELGSFESIGLSIARGCREGSTAFWEHPLLRHNGAEINRLNKIARPILFPFAPERAN